MDRLVRVLLPVALVLLGLVCTQLVMESKRRYSGRAVEENRSLVFRGPHRWNPHGRPEQRSRRSPVAAGSFSERS